MKTPTNTPANATGQAEPCALPLPMHAEAGADGLVHVFNTRGAERLHCVMTAGQALGIAAKLQRAAGAARPGKDAVRPGTAHDRAHRLQLAAALLGDFAQGCTGLPTVNAEAFGALENARQHLRGGDAGAAVAELRRAHVLALEDAPQDSPRLAAPQRERIALMAGAALALLEEAPTARGDELQEFARSIGEAVTTVAELLEGGHLSERDGAARLRSLVTYFKRYASKSTAPAVSPVEAPANSASNAREA